MLLQLAVPTLGRQACCFARNASDGTIFVVP